MRHLVIEPFRAFHAELLFAGGVQRAQLTVAPGSGPVLASLPGCALTAREASTGRVLACGGVVPFAPWLGTLWMLLHKDAGKHMIELHRATRRFLAAQPYRRLEASVPQSFPEGCRWLHVLGFRPEGPLEAYGEDGEDHLRYALIRRPH